MTVRFAMKAIFEVKYTCFIENAVPIEVFLAIFPFLASRGSFFSLATCFE